MATKYLHELIIAGIEVTTINFADQMKKDIAHLWQRFFAENIKEKVTHKVHNKIYALYTDYVSDFTKPYRFIIGCAVSNPIQHDKSLFVKSIPKLNYEVFDVNGAYPQSLINAWENIWTGNLKRAYIADFELYPEDFNPIKNSNLELYISVKD